MVKTYTLSTSSRVIIIIFLLMIPFGAVSQVNPSGPAFPTILPPSPDVAALGSFLDTSVSENTGIPGISVPMVSLPGKTPVPISLNYHAGGIRVSQISSRVGMGWSLSAGGMVTRSVRDKPDDTGEGLVTPTGATIEEFLSGSAQDRLNHVLYGSSNDYESDLYSYNFMGYSGSFFFKQITDANHNLTDIEVVQNPKTDILIEEVMDPSVAINGLIDGFIFTTPNGVKYYFGLSANKSRNALDKTVVSSVNQVGTSAPFPQDLGYTTSWRLMEIITPEQDSTSFYYDFNPGDDTSYSRLNSEDKVLNGPIIKSYGYHNDFVNYLTEISNSIGKITLEYTENRDDLENDRALTKVSLKNHGGNIIDSYELSYFYSISPLNSLNMAYEALGDQEQRLRRLFLDNVTQIKGNSENKVFSFDYYLDQPLPDKLSYSQDFWGYFNGKPNSSLYPETYVLGSNVGGADKHIDTELAKTGTLKRITYPTGGYTEYNMESNRVSHVPTVYALGATTEYEDVPIYNFNTEKIPNETYTSGNIFIPSSDMVGGIEVSVSFSDICSVPQALGCPRVKIYQVLPGSNPEVYTSEGIDETETLSFNEDVTLYVEFTNLSPGFDGEIEVEVTITGTRVIENEPDIGYNVGGLRVQSIKKYDHTDELLLSKRFEYTYFSDPTSSVSSGIALNPPVYYAEKGFPYEDQGNPNGFNFKGMVKSQIPYPLTNSGLVCAYENVRIIQEGEQSLRTDKTFLVVNNNIPYNENGTCSAPGGDDICQFGGPTPIPDFRHRTGQLLEERYYEHPSGYSSNPVKKIKYHYSDLIDEYREVENIMVKVNSNPFIYSIKTYNDLSERFYKKLDSTTTYFQNNALTTVTNYQFDTGYDGRMVPTEVATTTSDGTEIVTKTDYSQDLPTQPFMTSLENENRIHEPIRTHTHPDL